MRLWQLTLAAHVGAQESAAILLSAGAQVDARDANGANALHAAAVGSHVRTLAMLLEAGASHAARDADGRTAAHYAARGNAVPCLRLLRDAGVDLQAQTAFGWTPLHVASNHSCVGAMQTLLEAGCHMSQGDAAGWTPLHIATHRLGEGTNGCQCKRCRRTQRHRRRCVRMLLGGGASADAADQNGATPAHVAAAHDDVEGIRLLRAHRANLWKADRAGRTCARQPPLNVRAGARRVRCGHHPSMKLTRLFH